MVLLQFTWIWNNNEKERKRQAMKKANRSLNRCHPRDAWVVWDGDGGECADVEQTPQVKQR